MNGFEHILVPVDFSVNTEIALAKASELATPGLTTIHLLHVSENKNTECSVQLEGLASYVKQNNIKAEIYCLSNTRIEAAIIAQAKSVNADLVIVGKKNHHSFFPFLNTVISANIAEETACPVLTVKPGSVNKKLETVVMPVTEFFPKRKIDLLATLSNRMKLNVHLITILNNNQQPDSHTASALLQAMKSIRSRLHCNVQHCTIHSNNKAIATLRYAEKVNADILLVNPETETTITTWMSKKDVADVVKPALQVLSVQPN